MKALIRSDKVPAPAGPYSPGLTVGGWIFLSGQGGFDPNTGKVVSDDLAEQTEQTFDNIENVLKAAGASLDDVVSCLVHLVDLADFPAFNAVYQQKFTGVKPVRTTVRADLVAGLLVEITVIARAPSERWSLSVIGVPSALGLHPSEVDDLQQRLREGDCHQRVL